MKEIRVNHIVPNQPEGLVLILNRGSVKSAYKMLMEGKTVQLPAGTYFIYQVCRYWDGIEFIQE